MRVLNEALLDGVVTDAETTQRYLNSTQREIKHLSRLIDDLFELAKLDGQQLAFDFVDASLLDLLSDALEGMRARAAEQGVRLSGSIEDGINMLYMAPDKIQRVLYNLLDNALQFTPAGGAVRLTARQSGKWVEIRIHNSGSYIPAGELDRVFSTFYRGESSRTQRRGGGRGTGLGLAIARGFVEGHGGFIRAESDPDHGTTFIVRLPHTQSPF
jgi:signal transduction histidine kinase